jgi:AbrB family looped-hinge helix DNA binding protein
MAIVLAIYGFADLILLLAATVINERVRPIFHAVGIGERWKRMGHKENPIEGMCPLGESTMRLTKVNAKGQVTIPAELRERFGLGKGTRIDWAKDGSRLVLTPVTRPRKRT